MLASIMRLMLGSKLTVNYRTKGITNIEIDSFVNLLPVRLLLGR
jgi:hypothetical protein